jgi:hypothetical protein
MSDPLGSLGEFFRRSARNLAQVPGDLAAGGSDFMQNVNNAAQGLAEPTLRLMRGEGRENPLFPTQESGGESRLGDVASALYPHVLPGAKGGTIGTYGGRLANVPNKRQRSSAERAASKGMEADEIRERYGWFQAPDGDWKFEIPDNNARLVPEPDPTMTANMFDVWNPNGYKLEHPELLRAYPQLKQYKFRVHSRDDHGSEAYHDAANKVISLASDLPPNEALKAVLHELQHGVQSIEGFNPGASPWHPAVKDVAHGSLMAKVNQAYSYMQQFNSTINRWMNQQPRPSSVQDAWNMRQRFRQENPDLAKNYDEAQDILQNEPRHRREEEFRTYQRSLGETEARDSSERWNLTPEQRATITPYHLGRIRDVNEPFGPAQDIDLRAHLLRMPPKAADVPPDELRRLIQRRVGLLPE